MDRSPPRRDGEPPPTTCSTNRGRSEVVGAGPDAAPTVPDAASRAITETLPRTYGMGLSERVAGSRSSRAPRAWSAAERSASGSVHSTPMVRKPAPSSSGMRVPDNGECSSSTA